MPYFGSDWSEPALDHHKHAMIAEKAIEWASARKDVLATKAAVSADQYDRLARAEAALQKAVE